MNDEDVIASKQEDSIYGSREEHSRANVVKLETPSTSLSHRLGGGKMSPYSPSQLAAVGLTEADISPPSPPSIIQSNSINAVIEEAEEIQHLISNALDGHTGDSSSRRLFTSPTPVKDKLVDDMVSITVVRAWNLPEALGPTNPYIIIDWDRFGRSSTHSVSATTSPRFGSYLRFRSPFIKSSETTQIRSSRNLPSSDITKGGQRYVLTDVPIVVMAYSRSQSMSDELLGQATVKRSDILQSLKQNNNRGHSAPISDGMFAPLIIQLHTPEYEPAGYLEIILSWDE